MSMLCVSHTHHFILEGKASAYDVRGFQFESQLRHAVFRCKICPITQSLQGAVPDFFGWRSRRLVFSDVTIKWRTRVHVAHTKDPVVVEMAERVGIRLPEWLINC